MGNANNYRPATNADNFLHPSDYARLLTTHVRWWIVPAIVFALIAGAYSFVSPRQWKATQALTIRPEVASVTDEKLGKFSDLSEMKTLQETILELAKSQIVMQAALRDVGPPNGYRRPAAWPTALDIEAFRESIDMRPPGGSEFGKTEVFYLAVGDPSRQRACSLVAALCDQLEQRLQALREESARSMISELERTVEMADGDLASCISKLSSFEASIGADLAELRNLNADAGGQSESSQLLQAIEGERRANQARRDENNQLKKVLIAAQSDPSQLLATPNALLSSQPSLSQMKNGLVSAQLRTADLLGGRSEDHPFVIAAREAESTIRTQLNKEIAIAIRGLDVELQLCVDREKSLALKHASARERMSRLAASRAEYAILVSTVQNYTRLAEATRNNLADARARHASAHSASLITRIDGVEAGTRPVGPSRKTIAAAGGLGGLLFGFGLIFLFAGPTNSGAAPKLNGIESQDDGIVSALQRGDRSRTVRESFGMFRGMTLQQAVRAVERRTT